MRSLDTATRRRLTWAAPAAGAVVVAAAIAIPMMASAAPALPERTAAQLLVDVADSAGTPLSGTVVETARLGLPALPETGGSAISPMSLLSGSHTARVWYDGADKARVAVVGDLAETDLVRNGRDVWLWTSGKNTATHLALPAESERGARPTPQPTESLTPQQAAAQALAAIDPSTKVTVDGTASVAGRSAYELVLQPRDTRSLVGDVRLAVDSETGVPLRVQVDAKGSTGRPAFETAFTSVTFSKPSADVFRFSPPPGTTVRDAERPAGEETQPEAGKPQGEPEVIGNGWTSVVRMSGIALPQARDGESGSEALGALTAAMKPVSGPYGTGKVLKTKLVSVLLLDDGRLLVGAVPPSVLEEAAAK